MRPAFFGSEWLETPVYRGTAFGPGTGIDGPAIIEEPTSTLVVPPGAHARVTAADNYYLEV